METFYRVDRWSDKLIEKVEVIRSTKEFVVKERWGRESKEKKGNEYFETWEEAHAFLLKSAERKLEFAKDEVQRSEERLKKILALTKEE